MKNKLRTWISRLMHTALTAALLTGCVAVLCGCIGPQYSEKDKTALEKQGREMMQEWLKERLPDAELTSANAYLDILLGGPHELTDYVEGTYTEGQESFRYMLNTVSGEVFTSKGTYALLDPAWNYMLQKLELDPALTPLYGEEDGAAVDFGADLRLPGKTEGSMSSVRSKAFTETLLPWNVAYGKAGETPSDNSADKTALLRRIRGFLEDEDRAYALCFRADLQMPDDMDLSRFTSGSLMQLQAADKLYFDWIRIHNQTEDLWHSGWNGHYARYGWTDLPDCRLWTQLVYIEDTADEESEIGYARQETKVDPKTFSPIEKTEKGYRIQYPENLEHKPAFRIVAEPGSEILKFNYEHTADNGKTTRDCHWVLREDGSFELMNYDWMSLEFGYDTELWQRGDFDPAQEEVSEPAAGRS